jgi:hypothetical protein
MNRNKFIDNYADWIIKNRIAVIIATLLIAFGISSHAGKISFDTNYKIWFEKDDPYLAQHEEFLKEFGNDDNFVVGFEDSEGILRPEAIESIQRLTEKLWLVRGVIRVDSISNYQAVRATEDGLSITDLFPTDQEITPEAMEKAKRYIDSDPLIVGSLISTNKKVGVIRGKFAPNAINPELPAAVYAQMQEILAEEKALTGYEYHIAGGPITDVAFDQVAQGDMGTLMPILLLVMIGILTLMFFSFWAVAIPLFVAILTIASTMGVSGFLGFKLDAVTASSPQLLLGITVATVMHLLSTFFDCRRAGLTSKEAAEEAIKDNMVPILLTNLATTLGFSSFMIGNIVPVTLLGFMACAGSVFLTFLSLTLVPAILSYYPSKLRASPIAMMGLSTKLRNIGAWSVERPKATIMTWSIIIIAAAALIPSVKVDSNPTLYFKEGYWFRDAINFMEQKGSGGAVYEIVVRGNGEDAIKTAEYMQDLEKLTNYLEKESPGDFRSVYSLSTIVKNINRSMHGDDPQHHTLPTDAATIAQYLLLYSLSVPVGQDLNDRMNVDSSASRITVVRPLVSTKRSREIIDSISTWATTHLTHVKIEFTGRDVLYTNMGNNLTDSMLSSIIYDILVVIPLLLLMFRSKTAGVVSVFANVGPLIIVVGFMGLSGIMLDVGTLMVACLGLGIAVDDTVHLLSHYYKYRAQNQPAKTATLNTIQHIGAPATMTTITLMCSFLVFMMADFNPNFYFGLLISMIIFLALVADLTLTPSLLTWLDGKEKTTSNDATSGEMQQSVLQQTNNGKVAEST